MSAKTRWKLLLPLLAISAGLALLEAPEAADDLVDVAAPRPSMTKVSPDTPPERQSRPSASGPATAILELRPRQTGKEPAEAFATQNWTPPPPPPPPPAPPSAPPLPFTFLGKKFEEGLWQVFLGRNEETYIVKENDAIDTLYRVDAVTPPTLTLTYLPLQQQQILSIGEP